MMSISGHEGDIGGEAENGQAAAVYGNGASGKQPNFLQKLYDFMAVEPHPCPDVIYWAADSKQLVIAQPDKFTKKVLPRLFKHDKLSSFCRQLNIYGFSRMYPGRQFKDAEGNVSDASVWSHPSLHRLSTQAEISAIKRRAAPKLFRTRRLANGQVVRTRAGPSVQAKFHEIRDEMAESRRVRTLQSNTTVGLQPSGGGRDHTFDGVDHSHGGVIAGGRSLESGLTNVIHPQSPTRTFFWDRGRDRVEAQRLECIEEGVASSWASSFDFPPIHSLPVTSNVYRQGTSSFSAATPNNTYESHDSVLGHTQQGQHPGDGSTTKVSGMGMAVQSCPASIHTSPVLRSAELPPMAHALAPQHAHPNVVPHHMFSASLQHMPSHPLPTPQQLGLAFDQGPFPFRIAEPAAPNPFALSISPIHETPAHHRDSVASALSALSNLSTPSSAVSEYQGDQANASWHGDTIDPRWVSPATSQWSTPAVTPRSGSPVNLAGVPQHAHGY